ncbi:hypothetical protein GGR92_005222 [Spirosoma lacussanchae]|uniref:hypothetical protein n=1 Tax=Spirosoma lacussanchae TaxID=1884249 RepID=UPI00110930EA|nr:hypothetical protein [Spirosoma lacussanchae]
MALTSFDQSFDYTFQRAPVVATPTFPPTGTDSVGSVAGAVLPFSDAPGLMGDCLLGGRSGQAWEPWQGLATSTSEYLLPFVLTVPLPENLTTSPYCTEPLQIVDAQTGAVIQEPDVILRRFTKGDTLYIMHTGTQLDNPLPNGEYRLKLSDQVSDVFAIRCLPCVLIRIRLLNDTPIGGLLYGTYGFQQVVYVEGELTGPTYEESATQSGSEKTSGTVTKTYTLSLTGVTESLADALAHASLHKLVEVTLMRKDGSASRSIRAMAYAARTKVSLADEAGFDVELSLPVSTTRWDTPGLSTASCGVSEGPAGGGSSLVEVECISE